MCDDAAVEVADHPSPIESKVPSEPHMQTEAVTIRLQKALGLVRERQEFRIGAV